MVILLEELKKIKEKSILYPSDIKNGKRYSDLFDKDFRCKKKLEDGFINVTKLKRK